MPKAVLDIRSLARSYTQICVQTLGGIAQGSTSDSARVAAATELLNRGWGRPKPDDSDGESITIVIRRILEGRTVETSTTSATNGLPAIEGEVLPPEKP